MVTRVDFRKNPGSGVAMSSEKLETKKANHFKM
jgi:hypothetical protein